MVYPPGEYVRDELAARGWTPEQFAQIVGTSVSQLNDLLNGRTALTSPMAKATSPRA